MAFPDIEYCPLEWWETLIVFQFRDGNIFSFEKKERGAEDNHNAGRFLASAL